MLKEWGYVVDHGVVKGQHVDSSTELALHCSRKKR